MTTPKDRRDTVMSFMHWNGAHYKRLRQRQWMEVYLLGDGFGKINTKFAAQESWDWSHVRDSSQEAIDAMYERLADYCERRDLVTLS